jgi:hypothetical protein
MRQVLWFKNKSYGWGWTPCTWQGWLILAAFIGYNVKTFMDIDALSHSGSDTLIAFTMYFIGSAALLVVICYATGEKPRWRWGRK